LLITRSEYAHHLRNDKDFSGQSFEEGEVSSITRDLPEHFYLTEITLPDIYTANKSKIVDVVYVCDKPPTSSEKVIYSKWLLIRLPGVCFINRTSHSSIKLRVDSHYPLFRKMNGESVPEW
jgi:hypothetical protein